MAGTRPTPAQGLRKRQPTLDFIDTRLPEYHEAFANPQVHFNTALGRYAPVQQQNAQNGTMAQPADDDQKLDLLPEQPPPPPPGSAPARRPFWDEMFPQAMAQLRTVRDEPVGLVGTAFSIRAAAGWPEIVNTLEVARAKYYNYSGFIGFWKKAGHKMADHATDGKTLLSLLPDSEYTSLIHCVFDVIFDASSPSPCCSGCLLLRCPGCRCLTKGTCVVCRQPRGRPRSETRWRTACASCGRSLKMWRASWPFTRPTSAPLPQP